MRHTRGYIEEMVPERDLDEDTTQLFIDPETEFDLFVDGNLIVEVLYMPNGKRVMGWSKRNPNYDEWDFKRGHRIALTRLYRKVREYLAIVEGRYWDDESY